MDEILNAKAIEIKDDFIVKIEETKSEVFDETKPAIFRSGFAQGTFTGKPLSAAGTGICNILMWLNDNYANVILTFELGHFGPMAGYKVYDTNGTLIHEVKPTAIRGDVTQTNPVAAIEEIGRKVLTNLVTKIANEKGLLN